MINWDKVHVFKQTQNKECIKWFDENIEKILTDIFLIGPETRFVIEFSCKATKRWGIDFYKDDDQIRLMLWEEIKHVEE